MKTKKMKKFPSCSKSNALKESTEYICDLFFSYVLLFDYAFAFENTKCVDSREVTVLIKSR